MAMTVAEAIKDLEQHPMDAMSNYASSEYVATEETTEVTCEFGHTHEVPAGSGNVVIKLGKVK